MTRKPAAVLLVLSLAVLALALIPAVGLAAKGGGGGNGTDHGGGGGAGGTGSANSGCSVSPSQVALDQVWTVSAWGLPTSTVNMILTFPSGDKVTGQISVASGGTSTFTGNSNMSAGWGFIAPEQTGTYTYKFVGKVSWPAGTYTKLYAQCTVVVS